jgi:hypothetical protein
MGRVLTKFQEAQTVECVDDGYNKGKLSVVVRVLSELKCVRKEDAGIELNVSKTSILPKGTTQQAVC